MTKGLKDRVGLEVKLNDEDRLEFGRGVVSDGESIRKMSDLKVVVADESLDLSDQPAYFMYRNVHKPKDGKILRKNAQRFDLTVIPANKLGEEFIKTSGHYHPVKPATTIEYPELYYVLSGQATYLMQKHEQDGSISDVIISRVRPGEAIIMPLGYGHVTINELDKPLVMANWVEANFKSEYGDFELKRGATYYLMADGTVRKNPRYKKVAKVRTLKAAPRALNDLKKVPVYKFVESIKKIELIAKPELHLNDFKLTELFS